MAKLRLTLRRNTGRTTNTVYFDWSWLNISDISDEYALTLRNKYDALQEKSETHTPNDEYENFVNAHLETVAECIPAIERAKLRATWEILAGRKKRADVKTVSKCSWKNLININALKLEAQNELANICLKEYILNQINKIRDSFKDRRMANGKRSEQKEEHCENYTESNPKKNEYNYGNKISRIYTETLRKLRINQSRKLLINN